MLYIYSKLKNNFGLVIEENPARMSYIPPQYYRDVEVLFD